MYDKGGGGVAVGTLQLKGGGENVDQALGHHTLGTIVKQDSSPAVCMRISGRGRVIVPFVDPVFSISEQSHEVRGSKAPFFFRRRSNVS